MTVLEVANLSFGYGANQLFQGVTFSIEIGERVALVAPNGAGKSTLLRLIGKELAPDEGNVVVRREVRIAYARQSHELPPQGTVLDAFLSGFAEILALRHALVEAQHAAASGTDAALTQLATVMDRYHLEGGDELERRVTMIAEHLGFAEKDMERPLQSLSGGERGRLHLGVALAQDPDLLLLDEPTNHLDLDTIAWLERHLVGASKRDADRLPRSRLPRQHLPHHDGARAAQLPLVSRSSIRDYAVAREEDLARERELAERQEAFVAKTEDFIRKNIAGQKTKQAQSRRKMLDKLETLERPEDIWAVAEKVAFRFAPAPRSGDIVIEAKGLSAERGSRELFAGVDLLVRRGERIGIVGPNGSGKTTLLKLLAGQGRARGRRQRAPRDEPRPRLLRSAPRLLLDPMKTAVDEIRSVRGDLNADGARQYLARFRFYGDDSLRRVSGFSGGERSRLALAKLLLEPRNLLFLDEPTNHLDIPAAEILEEALSSFEGTVILVSHDRRFLEGVVTRVVHVKGGEVDMYPGGFRDYEDTLARKAAAVDAEAAAAKEAARESKRAPETYESSGKTRQVKRSASTRPQAGPPAEMDADAKRRAFESEKAAARALERKKKRVKELEIEIADGESDLERRREELKNDPGGNWAKLADLAKQEQALSKRVEAAMTEWMALSEELSGGAT